MLGLRLSAEMFSIWIELPRCCLHKTYGTSYQASAHQRRRSNVPSCGAESKRSLLRALYCTRRCVQSLRLVDSLSVLMRNAWRLRLKVVVVADGCWQCCVTAVIKIVGKTTSNVFIYTYMYMFVYLYIDIYVYIWQFLMAIY